MNEITIKYVVVFKVATCSAIVFGNCSLAVEFCILSDMHLIGILKEMRSHVHTIKS